MLRVCYGSGAGSETTDQRHQRGDLPIGARRGQAAPSREPALSSVSVTLGHGAAGATGRAGGEAENYRQNQGNAALSRHFRARRP